ncbi:DUF1415 domain-containing protein [Alcanivorax marinus]|nr:DUF1415 domain-containing protein [Alloalcanivorax marinus]MBL7250887.1 DUF1415 domain-containing protein [Alloalcanivorax marinus]
MNTVERRTRAWLEGAVLGLKLCPFARRPYDQGRVRLVVSTARDGETVLADLHRELLHLDDHPAVETTLLVTPLALADFLDYNDLLDPVDALMAEHGGGGVYQVASFHPHYQFAGTAPEDAENFSNRAPYPILHLLREDSLERALAAYPDADAIPERNIDTLNRIGARHLRALFAHW